MGINTIFTTSITIAVSWISIIEPASRLTHSGVITVAASVETAAIDTASARLALAM